MLSATARAWPYDLVLWLAAIAAPDDLLEFGYCKIQLPIRDQRLRFFSRRSSVAIAIGTPNLRITGPRMKD
jgi:hypothetical protein